MTDFLPGFAAGYLLGIFSAFALLLVVYAHREPPKRHLFSELKEGMDALAAMREESPPMPECKPAREDVRDGIDYRWLNVTGEEKS